MTKIIPPHGGDLKLLYTQADELAALKQAAIDYPSWTLNRRQYCDITLLQNGGFSPLEGFLNEGDYDRVVEDLRLADGTIWPIPVTLDVSPEFAAPLTLGDRIALRDAEGWLIAVMTVESAWKPDKALEAEKV